VVKVSGVWLAEEEELTMAARVTKADRLRAIKAARHDGREARQAYKAQEAMI